MAAKKPKPLPPFDLADALTNAGSPPPRKGTSQTTKRKYSETLSAESAKALERHLKPAFPTVTSGQGNGTPSDTAFGLKSFDVSWTLRGLGLAFGVSVKTVGVGEELTNGTWHYTHNYKRVAEEWTLETLVYHRFQPYATIIGILFLPDDAAHDRPQVTSLAAATKKFVDFRGRRDPRDDPELMEEIYIGLYDADATSSSYGRVRFWDVQHRLAGNEQPDPERISDFEPLVAHWQATVSSRIRGYEI